MKRFFVCLLLLLSFVSFYGQAEEFQFRFEDSKGKIHQLSDYRGKWVLVNFWATWCPPCLEEIPDLISLYQDRKDVIIIGIAMDYADTETIVKFADAMSIPYPIVFGTREIALQLDELSMLPSTYLFDPAGKPAARKIGLLNREEIEKFIQSYSGRTDPANVVDSPHTK
jgi:thiol-disulfide isomerase/thioredoxin